MTQKLENASELVNEATSYKDSTTPTSSSTVYDSVIDEGSHDLDSAKLRNKQTGEVEKTRQLYSGFVEMDSGNPKADLDKTFMQNMYVDKGARKVVDEGQDMFNRTKSSLEVESMDKTLIDLLATGYNTWNNYGLAEPGSEEYEDLKWFQNDLMENNLEAAQQLKDKPTLDSIISDEDYRMIDSKIDILKDLYQTGDGAKREKAQAAARFLSYHKDKVSAYGNRQWLDRMYHMPDKAAQVVARLDDSKAREDYERQMGKHSADIGSPYKPTGFWDGLAVGWQTNFLQSQRNAPLSSTDDAFYVFLRDNPDMDPTHQRDLWEMHQRGVNMSRASEVIRAREATQEYKQFEQSAGMDGNIGLGIGEFTGNPVNGIMANPLFRGAAFLGSKAPAIIAPLVTGMTLGASESVVNDVTGGKLFSGEEVFTRASWNAMAGGALFSGFRFGQFGLQKWSSSVSDKANKVELTNATDEVNKSLDVFTAKVEQARVISASDARVRKTQAEETKVMRAHDNEMDKVEKELVGLTVPESKVLLKDAYHEAGMKGHSKFKTKAEVKMELQRVRAKQAAEVERSKIDIENRRATERAAVKAEADKAKAEAEAKQADAEKSKQEQTEADAEDAFKLAEVNVHRAKQGLSKFTTTADEGFDTAQVAVKQETALAEAELDAATKMAARKSTNAFSRAYQSLTKSIGMRDMTTKGLEMGDSAVQYIAAKVLETGAGYAGRASRPATAALIKDVIYKRGYSNIMGSYQRNMNDWAISKGLNYIQNVNARNVGETNKYAREFHEEFYIAQEHLSMGDKVDIHPSMKAMMKDWDDEMGVLFKEARDAGVNGFGKNQRSHYVPRVWKKQKVANISNQYGEDNLKLLIQRSIESAQRKGRTFDDLDEAGIAELVDRQVNWINGLGDAMTSYKVGANARTKARAPLDMTTAITMPDGKLLRMVDLVDTNIPTMAATYTQRTSGSIGLAKATDGAIRDEAEFAQFAANASTPEAQQFLQDTGDMMFGYPTREGMNPAARMLMDSAQYAQLETLGVAQLATVGTSLQAVVANWASHPEVAKKILKMASQGSEDTMMRSIRERSAVNNNIRFSNRADVHNLDQAQLDEITDFSLAMNKAVDTLTGGDLKPLFSRGLGKLSAYDAVAQFQSRLTQASYTMETTRQVVLKNSSFSDERLVDLGVLNLEGGKMVDTKMSAAMKEHAEFKDGELVDMHFDKWSDDAMREYTYSMNRYEAQVMPYIMHGELPQFMNMPEMQFALHYLKTPIAFGTKGTGRQLGFWDREAGTAMALNTLSAGLVRYAYVAGTGAAYSAITGNDVDLSPDENAMKVHNYLDWLGYSGEIYNKGAAAYKAVTDGSVDPLSSELPPAVKQMYNMGTANPDALPIPIPGFQVVAEAIMERINNMEQ